MTESCAVRLDKLLACHSPDPLPSMQNGIWPRESDASGGLHEVLMRSGTMYIPQKLLERGRLQWLPTWSLQIDMNIIMYAKIYGGN